MSGNNLGSYISHSMGLKKLNFQFLMVGYNVELMRLKMQGIVEVGHYFP